MDARAFLDIARQTGITIRSDDGATIWQGRVPSDIPEFLDAVTYGLLGGG